MKKFFLAFLNQMTRYGFDQPVPIIVLALKGDEDSENATPVPSIQIRSAEVRGSFSDLENNHLFN